MSGGRAAAARDPGQIGFPAEYLERLIESSTDIVVAVDRAGTIVFYNDGAERILGYSAAEILGQNVVQIYPTLQEAHRVLVAMRSDDYGGPGKITNFETTFVNRWSEQIPVAISGAILFDDSGFEIGSIGFAKDLREIRRRDRLATLGEVTVGLCHEINSPLEVILNDVELLSRFVRRAACDADAIVEEERIDTVRREVMKIQQIVNRLVEMSQGAEYGTREYLHGQQMADLCPQTTEPKPAPPATTGELKGLRVLVADDDLGICRSLRDLLVAEGCEVLIASDGLRALRLLDRTSVDLVISDVVMPDLDGYDLLMEVRRRGDTPVILMTGYYYDRDHVIKRSRLQGLQSVVFKKPIDWNRLKTMILTESQKKATPA